MHKSFSSRGRLSANKIQILESKLQEFLFVPTKSLNSQTSLEIGFGDGEHIFNLACSNSDEFFLGAEAYKGGIAKLVTKLLEGKVKNVAIWPQDVRLLIERLPQASLTNIYMLFPDPWPKTRHKKRRLANRDFLTELSSKLQQGGKFYFASDSKDYCQQVRSLALQISSLKELECDQSAPYAEYVMTKYHRKSAQEATFLCYERA